MFYGIIIRMYKAVREVLPKENYILILTFENEEKREFDMKPYLELGIFRELKDPAMFNTVRPCFDSIEWENEVDLDPELLYQNSVRIT
jgi:hypothetical protein